MVRGRGRGGECHVIKSGNRKEQGMWKKDLPLFLFKYSYRKIITLSPFHISHYPPPPPPPSILQHMQNDCHQQTSTDDSIKDSKCCVQVSTVLHHSGLTQNHLWCNGCVMADTPYFINDMQQSCRLTKPENGMKANLLRRHGLQPNHTIDLA